MNLNKEQLRAVESTAKNTLVIAGPGSGKTAVLAARILLRITKGEIDPRKIVAITYTNAAARELLTRINEARGTTPFQVWKKEYLKSAYKAGGAGWNHLTPPEVAVDLGYIGTIHGYALKILGKYGDLIGLPKPIGVRDEAQSAAMLESVAEDLHYKASKGD
jgi:superfamily I DNA/RNA helicase